MATSTIVRRDSEPPCDLNGSSFDENFFVPDESLQRCLKKAFGVFVQESIVVREVATANIKRTKNLKKNVVVGLCRRLTKNAYLILDR